MDLTLFKISRSSAWGWWLYSCSEIKYICILCLQMLSVQSFIQQYGRNWNVLTSKDASEGCIAYTHLTKPIMTKNTLLWLTQEVLVQIFLKKGVQRVYSPSFFKKREKFWRKFSAVTFPLIRMPVYSRKRSDSEILGINVIVYICYTKIITFSLNDCSMCN